MKKDRTNKVRRMSGRLAGSLATAGGMTVCVHVRVEANARFRMGTIQSATSTEEWETTATDD